jgi:aryl-alcohol dehydrogenase-like predicted oxidoreductase
MPTLTAAVGRARRAALDKLGLGAARFGEAAQGARGRVAEAEAVAALQLARASGIDLIDLGAHGADIEGLMGRAAASGEPASETPGDTRSAAFRFIVKTEPLSSGVRAVEAAARAALARLGAGSAFALAAPAADLLGTEGPALWRAMLRLVEEGLYQTIGVRAAAGDDVVGLARRFKPDFMQVQASLLDQRLMTGGALTALAELGVAVHLRSVLQQGLLFLPRAGLPAALADAGPRLSRIQRTIAEAGADPLQAALAFALNRPEASAVIVGVSSAAELRAVIAAAAAPPPPLDWSALGLDNLAALQAA